MVVALGVTLDKGPVDLGGTAGVAKLLDVLEDVGFDDDAGSVLVAAALVRGLKRILGMWLAVRAGRDGGGRSPLTVSRALYSRYDVNLQRCITFVGYRSELFMLLSSM